MAIHGIGLEVGQEWLTRGGQRVRVKSHSPHLRNWPFVVELNGVNCYSYTVNKNGQVFSSESPVSNDLVFQVNLGIELPLQPTAEPQDANTVTSAQVNDWIDWHGGECPVGPSTPCVIRLRSGLEVDTQQPGEFDWRHSYAASISDIIAYRVVNPTLHHKRVSVDGERSGAWQTMMREAVAGIGDINSDAKGSGARYNNGKAPLELIPLSIIVPFFQNDESLTDAQQCALRALDALGMFQAREGNVYDVLRELGDHWEGCAKVFDYGRKKYSKREDCTCSASNAIRLSLKNSSSEALANSKPENRGQSVECANVVTTKTSSYETPSTEQGRQITTESGLKNLPTGNARGRASEKELQKESSILNTNSRPSITESSSNTGSREPSTTQCLQTAAPSAEVTRDFMSTTATPMDMSEQCFAIPATLALDLSKGLTVGLSAHSPTCGVHRTNLKSGEWNWAKGMKWSVPIGCAARHLMAIIRGETSDPESGKPHEWHVYCNVVMLLTYASTFAEGDDRPAKGMLL